jgi:4-diphosphocytidyl-2-C-methyl-D-erythritol kinase
VKITTPAKVNLSLRVRWPDETGYHPLLSIVQAIEPVDSLTFEMADEDRLEIEGIRLPVDDDNLIWRALRAAVPGRKKGLHIKLIKEIPTAAGLGGGSSDAAAALLAASKLFGFEYQRDVAASVGADVPFFRTGGLARMEGYGELLTPLDAAAGFYLGLVVPPFDLSTPAVYRAWDRLDFPETMQVAVSDLPPSLRKYGPLTNDLYPAALVIAPQLDDWRSELAHRWNRPVLMSGSGPSLFAFFGSPDEAVEAIDVVPPGSRFAGAVSPLGHGATVVADG